MKKLGSRESVPSRTYAFQVASNLGYDLINLGSAGSAYLDAPMAEYIAARQDWDIALFEFGVNVIGEWTAEQLYDRSYAWIDRVKHSHPAQKVIVTDMYYTHHDFDNDPKAEEFRKAVHNCVTELQQRYDFLYYINGLHLMGTYQGLSSDGLHPSDCGHNIMAERMTNYINDEILS